MRGSGSSMTRPVGPNLTGSAGLVSPGFISVVVAPLADSGCELGMVPGGTLILTRGPGDPLRDWPPGPEGRVVVWLGRTSMRRGVGGATTGGGASAGGLTGAASDTGLSTGLDSTTGRDSGRTSTVRTSPTF